VTIRSLIVPTVSLAVGFVAMHGLLALRAHRRPYTITNTLPSAVRVTGSRSRGPAELTPMPSDGLHADLAKPSVEQLPPGPKEPPAQPPAWRSDPHADPIRRGAAARPMLSTLGIMPSGRSAPKVDPETRWASKYDDTSFLAQADRAAWKHVARSSRELGAAPWSEEFFQFFGTVTPMAGCYLSVEGNENWIEASAEDTLHWISEGNSSLDPDSTLREIRALRSTRLDATRSACVLAVEAARKIEPNTRVHGVCVVNGRLMLSDATSLAKTADQVAQVIAESETKIADRIR
jgi:hypothetical protein